MSARRLLAGLLAGFALAALSWPSASLADHISITASVSARLKERLSEDSWIVEVSWTSTCNGAGAGGASYSGNLYLIDVDTGERIYLGGVSGASGKVEQLIRVKATERHVLSELKLSCFDNETLHGSASVTIQGSVVVIPARNDNGEHGRGGGGGGGGGSGGNDPTSGLANGGCKIALQGTEAPDKAPRPGPDPVSGDGAED